MLNLNGLKKDKQSHRQKKESQAKVITNKCQKEHVLNQRKQKNMRQNKKSDLKWS